MQDIQVWAVVLDESALFDELFHRALTFVDTESQVKIKKFYHRVDSCRTLIGRLLVRRMLKENGIPLTQMNFGTTQNGKPYLTSQTTEPPIAYNITHDNNVIAMAFGPGRTNPPAFSIGIDVMKTRVPGRESINEFIEVVGDQLSQREHALLKAEPTDYERVKQFFWMWTLKEAYTKALGVGLGFDFKRVEFDPHQGIVKVDGKLPLGWKFWTFTITNGEELYQGVVAEYLGDKAPTMVIRDPLDGNRKWLKIEDAVPFTNVSVSSLKT